MEVAVVGGGPAGAYCAERLARAGQHVSVFDPSHPREKACGGGVTPIVFDRYPELREIRHLGRPATDIRLRTPDGRLLPVNIPHPIDIFSRSIMDSALLERAKAQGAKHLEERVRWARVDDQGPVLETETGEKRFDFVIGADGASSVIRRAFFQEKPGGSSGWASGGFYVENLPEEGLYLEFLKDVKGYIWVFPRPGHSSVGVVVPIGSQNAAGIRQRVLEMLEEHYPGSLDLPRRPFGMSIPSPTPEQARNPRMGGKGFALIGDAASAVDSITGEGIHYAIDTAAFLSDALLEAGPHQAHELYHRRWMSGPGKELAKAAFWARYYYYPWSVSTLLRFAQWSGRTRRIVADLLMVKQPYTTLLKRVVHDAFLGSPKNPSA